MATPMAKSSKSCAVSGCTEPRLHRNYCAKHRNASLGKGDPIRIADLDRCVASLLEAIQHGVDKAHATPSASATTPKAPATPTHTGGSIPIAGAAEVGASATPASAPATVPCNAYIQLLQPITEKLLENIRSPTSAQPLPSSPLDIFSFSALGCVAPAPAATPGSKNTSPPRPVQPSMSDSDLASNPPGSPEAASLNDVLGGGAGSIIDVKVVFSKQKKKTPSGFELLEHSISGKHDADINKSGSGKGVWLCYQRGQEVTQAGTDTAEESSKSGSDSDTNTRKITAAIDVPKPITSLSIIFRDACEEPPYGFVAIDKTTLGVDANLNNSSSASARQVYLCVHRGEGAPIHDLGVIFHDKKEQLPAGYHELKHTPFGNRADLNAAMNASQNDLYPTLPGQAVFLCFRPNVTPVLQLYLPLLTDRFGTDSVSKGQLLYAKVLALLTALLYSYDQKMVLHALEGFMRIPADSIPPVLLNRFLQCVCDAAPCFQTYFTTQAHTALLKFLAHSFKTFSSVMSIDTFAKILEVCFLTRHEDKQNEISEGMIAALIGRIERAKPCSCCLQEKKASANIAMNVVAGGEGHSKPTHKTALSGTAAASPASSTTDGFNATPAVSSILCSACQQKRALSAAPLPTFCRELTLQLVSQVHTAKELESEVKAFQRHGSSGPDFRTDIAKLTQMLATVDSNFQSHLEKIAEPATLTRPPSAGNRGSIVGSLAALAINEVANDISPPPPSATGAASSAFAFDVNRVKIEEKDRIFVPNKDERFLQVATLLCAKFAGESVSFGLVKSEQIKRKLHALRLLFYILHHGVYFFRSTPGGILLVRRFVCPALIKVCVTDSSLLWRLLLQTFTVLYDQYRQHLMIELGVFFDHILLSLLESTFVTCELKKDVLDMFTHILAAPQHLVGLFYNFDNHSKNWTIFERLHTVLARITEGEQKSFVPIHVATPAAVGMPTTPVPSAEQAEQQEEALQRQALKLLVHNLHMLAQWVGVPGLKRSPDIPSQPLFTDADEVDDTGAPINGAPATGESTPTKVRRGSRIDTWSWRHDKQKQDQKTRQESLKLARTEKLKSALQYLRIVDPAYAQPKQIAHFLYTNEGLDKSEVGDFLGSCGDKFMDDADYEALRAAYLEHLDFTGLLFDQGLRLFLCDSGFRLPGEAQKIDRLLEAFCVAYCRDNPNVFRNHSSAFVVSFALVMLNTDLHDSRLKSGSSRSRQPMTEEQFIGNLRGVDVEVVGNVKTPHDFPRVFLETLYRNIAASAIEWKEKPSSATGVAAEEKAQATQTDLERSEEQAKAVRKTFEMAARRALAYLKNWAAHEQGYNQTSNTMIAAGMFESIWYRIISVITARSDAYKQGDVELLHVCLEGLAYGSTIAICLGLPTERQAFSRQLAKITFIERFRESSKASNMHLRIVQGEHLRQDWYRPFNLQCEKSPVRACHVVFECAHDVKQRINFERRQAKLRQIESDFNHEIVLVDPARSFVREGPLTKLSNSSATKKQQYTFLLFTDLILYASEGINSKWKCHRVIHLSLCRLEDLRGIAHSDAHAFRIVSPQKSFVVSAPSKEKKQQWLESIFQHLKLVMVRRKKYIDAAKAFAANGTIVAVGSPPSPSNENEREELLRRYSTFIGQSDTDLSKFTRQDSNSGNSAPTSSSNFGSGTNVGGGSSTNVNAQDSKSANPKANHCKLCIRPWAMFRRRAKCKFCGDGVCGDCSSQKCMIPGGEKRLAAVCDACYGTIKGMVGDDVPLLSISDA